MATLLDYYELDNNNTINISKKYTVKIYEKKGDENFGTFKFEYRAHLDFKTNAYYLSIYLGKTDLLNCPALVALSKLDEMMATKEDIELELTKKGENKMKTSDMIFTRRIYIYDDNFKAAIYDREVQEQALKNGHFLQIRRNAYAESRNKNEKPYAFLSHDSRDKDLIAKPIVHGLAKLACPIWYDEYSLQIGDSLRESIEKGIKETNKCILVLTPNFLKNPGWTKTEFNSVFTKDLLKNNRSILPIWYQVTKEQVYEYSPMLLDTVALIWPEVNDKDFVEKQKHIIQKLYKATKL
jgi:hypothetical protein